MKRIPWLLRKEQPCKVLSKRRRVVIAVYPASFAGAKLRTKIIPAYNFFGRE